jgi:hypothetical protein
MVLVLFLALAGCTKSAGPGGDDTEVTDDSGPDDVETGVLSGVLNYPQAPPAGAKMHIAIKAADDRIWTESDYREVHEAPTFPFTYTINAPAGTYYLGAFIDLTNDTPGGPGDGDPKGAGRNDTGLAQYAVVVGQTTSVPPIDLKVQSE